MPGRFQRPAWRVLAWLLLPTALLVLAACGTDDDAEPGDDEEAVVDPTEAWATCSNDEGGWTVEHPEDWNVNDGEDGDAVAPCSLFDPEPIEVPDVGHVPIDIAVQLRIEEPARGVEDLLEDPFAELLDRSEATVDGHLAHRLERQQTDDGIIPIGTRSVRWVVDLGDEALIAVSYAAGEPDFATKVGALDQMMERLRFHDEKAREDEVEEGAWETLPEAPIETRLNAAAAWAGDRFLVWGGGDDAGVHDDGAAWFPADGTWEPVPSAPVTARWLAEAVWTGDDVIVWGGTEGPDHLAACHVDGARYDPVSGQWQEMAPAPGPGRCGAVVAWTGNELLVVGGQDGAGPPGPDSLHDDGVAYDPDADQWREIPPAPIEPRSGAVGAWVGSELVVVGGTGAEGEPIGDGAAYDPESDAWRVIADMPLDPRSGLTGDRIGDELLVFGGRDLGEGGEHRTDAAAYDPEADTWRQAADLPAGQGDPQTAWTGAVLYVVGGETQTGPDAIPTDDPTFLAYVADEDAWVERPDPPAVPRRNHVATWSGAALFLWGGQSQDEPNPPAVVWQPPS